jgi:hypothetical protein
LIDIVIADENLHAASSFNLIGSEFRQSKGATKASPSTPKRAHLADKTANVHLRSALRAK